jgi:ribosome-binding protein aMBF1 (putative translation factor)
VEVHCDLCGKTVDDNLLQIVEEGSEIYYACSECFFAVRKEPPEEQA